MQMIWLVDWRLQVYVSVLALKSWQLDMTLICEIMVVSLWCLLPIGWLPHVCVATQLNQVPTVLVYWKLGNVGMIPSFSSGDESSSLASPDVFWRSDCTMIAVMHTVGSKDCTW